MRLRSFLLLGCSLFLCSLSQAQNWGRIEGRVSDARNGLTIPGATVLVEQTNYGTATNADGLFSMRIPTGTYRLRVSAIGFTSVFDTVVVRRDESSLLDIMLAPSITELQGVDVEADTPQDAGVFELSPEQVQNIPGPFRTAFHAIRVLPGVAANNELSNQFSVRGGGMNENLIFLNGFEVYLPFRPRQGEQEGLGLLNPDLTSKLTLFTGGFPARYGGKLSSALDVRYHRPDGEPLHGSASLSLLDAGVSLGSSAFEGKLGWVAGVRKAQAQRFFSTQELKGQYQPDYTDVQGMVSYRLTPDHEVEATGVWVDHRFRLEPSSRRTYFGFVSANPDFPSDFQSVYTAFTGDERDGYRTEFGGLRLRNRLSRSFRVEHDVAYFGTDEFERMNIQGNARHTQVDPGSGGETPLDGDFAQADSSDNRVEVNTLTAQGRYSLTRGRHAAEAGWLARRLQFEDRIDESFYRRTDTLTFFFGTEDSATLSATQVAFYAQDALDLHPTRDRLVATVGLRADYFSFNREWTVSPRLALRYLLSTRTTLTGSAGLYYQPPSYQELRGEPQPGETILGALNDSLRSQRSLQLVGGMEHFFARKRLYLRIEGYYKHLSNLISYNVENVRVGYSGENDSEGYIYGLDLQLRGEFVPGLESWINYGFMVGRERFLPAYVNRFNEGLLPRPTDQRHTFSLYVQDYVPGDDTWKIHMRALFGSGYPFTPLVRSGGPNTQAVYLVPGPRHAFRYTEYKRMDVGVTKSIAFGSQENPGPVLYLTGEILNLFDMVNEVSSQWVYSGGGWTRVPIRLTPRTINVRLRVAF